MGTNHWYTIYEKSMENPETIIEVLMDSQQVILATVKSLSTLPMSVIRCLQSFPPSANLNLHQNALYISYIILIYVNHIFFNMTLKMNIIILEIVLI